MLIILIVLSVPFVNLEIVSQGTLDNSPHTETCGKVDQKLGVQRQSSLSFEKIVQMASE